MGKLIHDRAKTLVLCLLMVVPSMVVAQQSGEVGIKPVGEAWEKLEKRAPAATRVITQIKPAKSADSNTIQIGIPSSVGDDEVKVSRRYSAKGIDDCLKCHDETEQKPILSLMKTKHAKTADGRTPMAQKRSCEVCHGPSAEHFETEEEDSETRTKPAITFGMGPGKSKIADQNKVCMDCHTSDNTMHWQGSQHEGAELSCSSCHSIHAKQDPMLDMIEQKETCFNCHKAQRAQIHRPSTHPIKAGQMTCSNCHQPHGTSGERLLKKGSVVETCFQCHADKRGPFLWEHTPVREDCTNCHTPHGSVNKKLLKSRAPFLCQKCHMTNGGHIGSLYDNADITSPSSRLLRKGCLNCHSQVHGSNHPSGRSLHR